jgi:hypothetical protein
MKDHALALHWTDRLEHLATLMGKDIPSYVRQSVGTQGFSRTYVNAFNHLVGGKMFNGTASRRTSKRVEALIKEHEDKLANPSSGIGSWLDEEDAELLTPPPKKPDMPKCERILLRRLKRHRPKEYERQVLLFLERYTWESVFAGDRPHGNSRLAKSAKIAMEEKQITNDEHG